MINNLPALSAQGVGLIEYRRNPPLFGERRQENPMTLHIRRLDERLGGPGRGQRRSSFS